MDCLNKFVHCIYHWKQDGGLEQGKGKRNYFLNIFILTKILTRIEPYMIIMTHLLKNVPIIELDED